MRNFSAVFNSLTARLKMYRRKQICFLRYKSLRRELRFENMEDRRMLATFHVTNNADAAVGTTAAVGTLRQAINDAQLLPGPDVVDFDASVDGEKIILNQGELSISGSLSIDASMLVRGITIDAIGNDPNQIAGDGVGSRIFHITDPTGGTSPPQVKMVGLTLTGGDSDFYGGAIISNADLELQNCTLAANYSEISGGAITQYGSNLTLNDCTISGNHARTFSGGGVYVGDLPSNAQVNITGCTISNNSSAANGGGIEAELVGEQSLTIDNSKITGNSTSKDGGGIAVTAKSGDLSSFPAKRAFTISNSTVSGNTCASRGGGIYARNFSLTETLIDQSTISGNQVTGGSGNYGNGGGVYAYVSDDSLSGKPTFTISGSTIDNNKTAEHGGGIFVCGKEDGEFVGENSTLSDNSTDGTARDGGGIFIAVPGAASSVDAFLINMTITQNHVDGGTGGGVGTAPYDTVRVRLYNSIVSKNYADALKTIPDNLAGRFDATNLKYNLVGSGPTIYNLAGTSPVFLDTTNINSAAPTANDSTPLGNLQFNGGPTETHALLAGSPAIDAGSSIYAFDPLTMLPFMNDQRGNGFTRFYDISSVSNNLSPKPIDIGAYEMQMPKVIDVILDDEVLNGTTMMYEGQWGAGPISYAKLVALGQQLAPIYRAGTNTIKIAFSETISPPVLSTFTLFGMPARHSNTPSQVSLSLSFDPVRNIAILRYSGSMPLADRFRLDVQPSGIVGLGGTLDGEWSDHVTPGDPHSARYDQGTLFDWDGDATQNLPADMKRNFPSGIGTTGTSFQFKFAVQPGDYDQNGIVDLRDYDVWQNGDPRADGTGNNIAGESGDYDVWRDAIDQYLWLQRFQGDFTQDGIVDYRDYALWRTEFGNTFNPVTLNYQDLQADGNDSGTVDMTDEVIYRYWENTASPWSIDIVHGTPMGTLLVDSTSAPEVVNVTISGSASANSPYSFATHVGSGVQLQTVPVGAADSISITFSEQVNVEAVHLQLVGLRTGHVPTLASFAYDPVTFIATWRFTGLLENDNYAITLSDAITDTEGYRLDGEWKNPVSTTTTNLSVSHFPSGDGHAGGNFSFVFTMLAGDANQDNQVGYSPDYSIWSSHYYQHGGFTIGDFDGNGVVDSADIVLFYSNLGRDLRSTWVLGDLNGDFKVNDADLMILVGNYGMTGAVHADGDLNGDGQINDADIDLMFAQYGLELTVVS